MFCKNISRCFIFLTTCSFSGAAFTAEPDTPTEEIIVRGSREGINLKLQVDQAEDEFYAILNDLLDEEFRITCRYERVINSIIKERICQTRYMRNELSTAATLGLSGIDYMAAGVLTEKNRQLREQVVKLLESNSELRNAARNLSRRVEEYRDEYGIRD